jgi:hypothetical protein
MTLFIPVLSRVRTYIPYLVRIVPMSVCTNLGLNQSSRLADYAGYVVLCERLHMQRAYMRTRARRPPIFIA